MKRLALLLLIFIGPVLLSGLIGCDDCNPAPTRYRLDGYSLRLQRANTNQSSSQPASPLASGDTVSARDLELALVGDIRQVGHSGFSGGNSAFACDPAIIPLDRIATLRISSDQAYTASLPAGSNLTAILGIGSARYTRTSVADYLSLTKNEAEDYYLLTPLSPPDRIARHRFTVTVELSNGTVLADTTQAIVLTP